MRELWSALDLEALGTTEIQVQRTYADFNDYWTTFLGGASVSATLAAMSSDELEQLKSAMRVRLRADSTGRIICSARANAVRGQARSV
jgi:hypothetical protein